MYEGFLGHFGLARNPFQVSPDPAHFYSTVAHDEAVLQLVSRIEARQGFLVLTGDAGTGKTMVLRYLLDWLRKYSYSTAYVFYPLFRSTDVLELILGDFGIPCNSHSKRELMLTLKNWLIDRRKMGDCPVIIIDEAQALKSRTLRKLGALAQDGSARIAARTVGAGRATAVGKEAESAKACVVAASDDVPLQAAGADHAGNSQLHWFAIDGRRGGGGYRGFRTRKCSGDFPAFPGNSESDQSAV